MIKVPLYLNMSWYKKAGNFKSGSDLRSTTQLTPTPTPTPLTYSLPTPLPLPTCWCHCLQGRNKWVFFSCKFCLTIISFCLQGVDCNVVKIEEVTGICDRARIHNAIAQCSNDQGTYELDEVISVLLTDAMPSRPSHAPPVRQATPTARTNPAPAPAVSGMTCVCLYEITRCHKPDFLLWSSWGFITAPYRAPVYIPDPSARTCQRNQTAIK